MRDFRDAKTMAQTLRERLATKAIAISHSESLEVVSKMFGISDWNTFSALLRVERKTEGAAQRPEGELTYPAIPIRDFVPFPSMTYPLFIGRQKTKLALDHAFEGQREVVLVVQKDPKADEPGPNDVCNIGVLARLLELERLPDGTVWKNRPLPDGTMKILLQAQRRVMIHRFVADRGAFQAQIDNVSEGPIPEAPQLVKRSVEKFESYSAAHDLPLLRIWPPLGQMSDPGRVADVISQQMPLPLSMKQALLTTLDPIARLKEVAAVLNA